MVAFPAFFALMTPFLLTETIRLLLLLKVIVPDEFVLALMVYFLPTLIVLEDFFNFKVVFFTVTLQVAV